MNAPNSRLSALEKKATFSIAAIFALRMFGLFMIVPIFALYARNLSGTTPLLLGIAIGCYGLTQALLQIPFGILSDYKGRKPIILLGLLIFILGSVVAGLSHSIWGVIIGRSLQGAGAIGSATSALLTDLTRVEHRTKAMAITGITIGTAFSVAMIFGPFLASFFNGIYIFWLSTLFGFVAIFILLFAVPQPIQNFVSLKKVSSSELWAVFCDPKLARLNTGILILHAILTATFVVLPITLLNLGFTEKLQWHIYLPVLLFAFVFIVPLIRLIEKYQSENSVILQTVFYLGCSEFILFIFQHFLFISVFALWLFFTSFTLLEALLPSAVSKIAPAEFKGAALGVFSSSQFLGIFLGGVLGGWVYGHYQIDGVFLGCISLAAFWMLLIYINRSSSSEISLSDNN